MTDKHRGLFSDVFVPKCGFGDNEIFHHLFDFAPGEFFECNQFFQQFLAGTEVALFRTDQGGMARMVQSWDTPGFNGEMGRIRSESGTYYGKYEGLPVEMPTLSRPPLPPGVPAGDHGGSHGNLTNEFILSILENRKPMIDVAIALNMTVPGIIAHQSALRGGELFKIPQFTL